MNNRVALVIGAVLIGVGVLRPDLSDLIPKPRPSVVTPSVEVSEPSEPALREAAQKVVDILQEGDSSRKTDGLALSSLYSDIAKLISLDSENEVVRTTAEIREVNSVSGSLMNLKLQGKYPGLANAAKDLVVSAIGDDIAVLNESNRSDAVAAFEALAWACYEGAK